MSRQSDTIEPKGGKQDYSSYISAWEKYLLDMALITGVVTIFKKVPVN